MSKFRSNQNPTDIVKQGSARIQYGLSRDIQSCWILLTKRNIIIIDESENKKHISWDKLLNIDYLNGHHHFQLLVKDDKLPIIYIHCSSQSIKQGWIKTFEKSCSRFILSKELKFIKQQAEKLGFDETQIENTLIEYHKKYDTVYNVEVFLNMILNSDQSSNYQNDHNDDDDKKEQDDEDTICGICHEEYTNPVKNIHNKIYCLNCIKSWYEIIKEEQTEIRDPLTNQRLPQHCRLLIPYFSKMVQVWNSKQHRHSSQQRISVQIQRKIKELDSKLNAKRIQILEYLKKSENYAGIIDQCMNGMMSDKYFRCNKSDLGMLVEDAVNCHQHLVDIKNLIAEASKVYNDAIKNMIDTILLTNISLNGKSQNGKISLIKIQQIGRRFIRLINIY